MDDAALVALLAEIRHQSVTVAVDAELLRRQIAGREPTEAEQRRAREIAAVALRYKLELDMAWAIAHERRTLRGTLRRALAWLRSRGPGRA